MKVAKVLAIALVASIAASQAFADEEIGKIYEFGEKHEKALRKTGVRLPLNYATCLSVNGLTAAIYSHDFCHDGTVFVVRGNELTRLSKAEASVFEKEGVRRSKDGMIERFDVTVQDNDFKCERSAIQLEAVGG